MVARRLSQISGLDWAIMSGGDVGPLGAAASTEIHAILNWARRSPKGLLLFVDEAEAALCDRGRPDLSEEAISALNAFLYHTSDPSYTFMLVLATNRPGDLDAAVLDRVDEAVEIPLPDITAREKLLHLYFAHAFDRAPPSSRWGRLRERVMKRFRAPDVSIDLDRTKVIQALAKKTTGYSGRECSKLMLSVQGAVYATERTASGELVLNEALWERTVRWKLEEVKPRAVADLTVAVE
jgi:ATPase family AAA domain-containing protein 3A/B